MKPNIILSSSDIFSISTNIETMKVAGNINTIQDAIDINNEDDFRKQLKTKSIPIINNNTKLIINKDIEIIQKNDNIVIKYLIMNLNY